jgi:hypothetical protein
MESEQFYKRVFLAGSFWNWIVSIPLFALVWYLPTMIKITEPLYPIFIYFNLMTVAMFGCVQYTVSKNPPELRGFVKILAWSKILTFFIFVAAVAALNMPSELTQFLAGGMVVDLLFGLLFWRYLVFSKKSMA